MATNYIQDGEVLDYTASADIAAGSVVVMGSRIGVAIADIATGAVGAVGVEGVWELPKASADTIAQGDVVYWDATNGNITTTSTGNTQAGYAAAAAAAGATTVQVKIND